MSITSVAGTLNFPFLVFDTFRFPAGGDVFVRHARNKRQLSTMIQRVCGLVPTYHFTSSSCITHDSAVILRYAFTARSVENKKKGEKMEKLDTARS